ncbi:aspartyl protease family protein [Psychroflexus aestuariivivens]|uniref:aspartyl protease family protein n=1 Tax=Psychroflexus aestuariivivens TaxID=1795040 RepID=UPI000FD986B3|nr:aspartyl protease family protein [Psychroflexus aestuariivivens]
MMRHLFLKFSLIVSLFTTNSSILSAQETFKFKNEKKRALNLRFQSINNLIILKAKLNGQELNFLLDSGVSKTVVFAKEIDSALLKDFSYVNVKSYGSKIPVKAYRSEGNKVDFGKIVGHDQDIYFIVDERMNLSQKIGINIQGIIGYEFLKSFVFRINYLKNSIRVYQHEKFNRNLRSFKKLDFRFYKNKPHFKMPVQYLDGQKDTLVMLMDLGASDSFWVFEDEKRKAPKASFTDIVGYGLESPIYGKRSKLQSAKMASVVFEYPRASFVDESDKLKVSVDDFKNGLVGGEILRRFKLFLNYKTASIYLKPNQNFDDTFNYDRSGLILTYSGKKIKTYKEQVRVFSKPDEVNTGYNQYKNEQKFKIRYQVTDVLSVENIRPNSPASQKDIQIGDQLLSINGSSVDKMDSKEIIKRLSQESGTKIKLKLLRQSKILKREIILENQFDAFEKMN